MLVRTYDILQRAVEEGIAVGWRRAHKHSDNPSGDSVKESIEREVMGSICEVFDFEDRAEGP